MPESIRNAIVFAFVAVIVALVGVGLQLWTTRPPTRPPISRPLLVNDPAGGVYDLSVKVEQIEYRFGESQLLSQQLMEQLKGLAEERADLSTRVTGLENEVRSLRKRLQQAEQRPATRPPASQSPSPLSPATRPQSEIPPPPISTAAPITDAPAAPPP